ncbi:MAG: DMT family transporter [Pseudomonadota bacterium]
MTADAPTRPRLTRTQYAVIAMLLASALIAGTTLIAKVLGRPMGAVEGLHPLIVSAGRFVFALAAALIVVAARPRLRPSFNGARFDLHLGRSLCGWLGVTALFAASARMPLAEATAIGFLSPLVTMVLAILILKESATLRKAVAAGLAVLGALALLRPGTEAFQPAALFALAAALLFGVESVFIKRLSDSEPPLQILIVNNAIGSTIALAAASFVWEIPIPSQWLLLAALGVVMVSAQAWFIQAMRNADASAMTPVFYTTLIFAALYDFALFGVLPVPLSLFGAALIMIGAWLLSREPEREAGGP